MQSSERSAVKAGGFVALSFVILMISIFFIGSKKGLFTPQYSLRASFKNVAGLVPGAQVRLQGVTVGGVESISFPLTQEEKQLFIVMKINKSVQKWIKEDSLAHIETIGLLGDKYIEITFGSPESKTLNDKEEIKTVENPDYFAAMQKGGEILDNVRSISEGLKNTMNDFKGTNTLQNLDATTASIKNILKEMEEGNIAKELSEASAAIKDVVSEIKGGQGTAHALVYGTEGKDVLSNLARTSDSLADLAEEVKSGHGTLHAMIYTEEGKNMLGELEKASSSLRSIMGKIDKGEGTLGALIADKSIYNNLVSLLEGVQRSAVLKALVELGISTSEPIKKKEPSKEIDANTGTEKK